MPPSSEATDHQKETKQTARKEPFGYKEPPAKSSTICLSICTWIFKKKNGQKYKNKKNTCQQKHQKYCHFLQYQRE